MNKIFMKATVGLALGLSLLAPTALEAHATNTNPTNAAEELTPKQKYEKNLLEIEKQYNQLRVLVVGEAPNNLPNVIYANADKELKDDFDAKLKLLGQAIAAAKENAKDYTSQAQYNASIQSLQSSLNIANESKNKLNGKLVDNSELNNLNLKASEFRQSDAFKTATEDQVKAYEKALSEASAILPAGSTVQRYIYEERLAALKNAINDINESSLAKSELSLLKDEIKLANEVVEEKDSYTSTSYQVFNSAYIVAKTAADKPSNTSQDYKAARENLEVTRKALVKKTTANDKVKEESIERLKRSIKDNETIVKAAEFLLEYTPETVKEVKPKLENLMKNAKDKQAEGRALLNRLEGIQG